MIEKVIKLTVKFNALTVGYLVELQDGRIAFQYDEKWRQDGFSILPFSLTLSKKVFINNSLPLQKN